MSSLVSIIIPCYNTASLISETLDSVLSQTYKFLEIIVVNDGSTDDLDSVMQQYLTRYSNIIYLKQDNAGVSNARNNGVKIAKGDYLLFVDSDDLIFPSFLEKCVPILDADPCTKVVRTNGWKFGREKEKWKLPSYSFRRLLMMNVFHVTSLLRRSDFIKVGMFDEKIKGAEDWNLWIDLLKEGGRVAALDDLLFSYRKRTDNSSLTDFLLENTEYAQKNKQRIYNNHKASYDKEFGNIFDMLDLICLEEKTIERYERKKAKWYRRLFRF